MSEVLNIRCPVCGRLAPISAWEKIAASDSDYLGLLQRFGGRGKIETLKKIARPDELDWIDIDGFGLQVQREPAPFELLKGKLLSVLSGWLDRSWISDRELAGLGLKRLSINLGDLVSVSRTAITKPREVITKTAEFEF